MNLDDIKSLTESNFMNQSGMMVVIPMNENISSPFLDELKSYGYSFYFEHSARGHCLIINRGPSQNGVRDAI